MAKKDPNNHITIGKMQSDKGNKTYLIGVDKKISKKLGTAHFTCECHAFKFSGKGGIERHCKHVDNFVFHHFFDGDSNKILHKIKQLANTIELGPETIIETDPINKRLFLKTIDPQSFFLTELHCPSMVCSHMMIGKFNPEEIQSCEKCGRKFMP